MSLAALEYELLRKLPTAALSGLVTNTGLPDAQGFIGFHQRDGKWYFRQAGSIARQNIEGHDVSPAVVDFDGDGVMDFLGGAEDGRFYFLANPRSLRAPAGSGEADR